MRFWIGHCCVQVEKAITQSGSYPLNLENGLSVNHENEDASDLKF